MSWKIIKQAWSEYYSTYIFENEHLKIPVLLNILGAYLSKNDFILNYKSKKHYIKI